MLRKFRSSRLFLVLSAISVALSLIVFASCTPEATTEVTADTPSVAVEATVDDVGYMAALGLMKGHLYVAKELMELDDLEAALPHVGHPVEELYGDVEDGLEAYGIAQFDEQLNVLTELVEAKVDAAQIATAYDESMASIDDAIAAIPAEAATSPDFVHSVLKEILGTAEEEYEGAIADNTFVEVVEYQDSRGFVQYANEFYSGVKPALAKANPEGTESIAANLDALQAAWPDVMPPDAPVLSVDEVESLVGKINTTQP